MSQPSIQTSFAAGELSPSLFGHVDFTKFGIGTSTERNFFTSYRGGAYSRAGFEFVGYSKQTINNIATGSIFFPTNPSPGDTITLNGVVFTFVAGSPAAFEFHIAGNAGGTIALAVIALNSTYATNPALNGATYSETGGSTTDDLVITFKTPGATGNAYTLAASAATVSGAHLSGGGNIAPRMVTFQFSLNQGLVLEFGHQYMRVISRGAFVTETGSAISGATKASPCVITQNGHGYSSGNWIFEADIEGMAELNGRTFIATVLNANTYQLFDVFGDPINSTAYTTYTGGGIGSRIYELATPYAAEDLKFLKFSQSADVMSLTLRNQETGTEYAPYELSRLADDNWTLTALDTGPNIAAPTGAVGTATSTTSVSGMTDYQFVVTAISETGAESVASNIADIPNSVQIEAVQGSINLRWNPVAAAAYYQIYKAFPAVNSTVPIGSLFGYVAQTFGNSFVDNNILQDMSIVPPLHRNPFLPGQALSVTIITHGSSIVGPVGFTIASVDGSGATGYGILEGGEMVAWVFDDFGGLYLPGDTITFFDTSGSTATGDIDFSGSGNPANGDTITLNGRVFTFVNDSSGFPNNTSNYKINIAFSLAGTLAFLADPTIGALNVSPTYLADALLNIASYDITATELDITFKTAGTGGNAYTLAASAATPSGGTLTGGTGGIAPTGTLNVGPIAGTYPSCVSYFQQRRVYANSANQPDTYWMSQPGSFSNFDSRIPTIDSDAVTGSPWSVQVNGVQFMLPVLGGLIMLTGQTAYQVFGTGGSPNNPVPVTPSSQQALPQAYNGCHFFVPPVLIDYDIYYLQSKGSVVRSLSYNFFINVFTGVDITYLSSHLFTDYTLLTMSWCEEPFKVMWAVRNDGILLSLTSLKSQDVMAWTRHDTQGLFVASTAVTEPPVDALYVATQRFTPAGDAPFMIERMNDRRWPTVESAWCVDAGLSLVQPTPTATINISSASGLGQPVGYSDLSGGGGFSDATTIEIVDPTGVGCVVTPVITAGVITNLLFSGGADYTAPIAQAIDPQTTGNAAGFAAVISLDNIATVTSDASVFVSGDVGKVIRAGGGIMEIVTFNSATSVDVQIVTPIAATIPNTDDTPQPFDPGEWTMTRPVTTVTGLWHLVGYTVTGLADGNVITPRVVASNGTITLDDAASSIVVGLAFEAQLQSLYMTGTTPSGQGRRKNIGAVTVRVENSGDMEVGTNQPDGSCQSPQRVQTRWRNMAAASTNQPGLAQRPYGTYGSVENTTVVRAVPLYTGDIRVITGGGFQKQGQIAVQQRQPLPVNVLAFMPETDMGDDVEEEASFRNRGTGQ